MKKPEEYLHRIDELINLASQTLATSKRTSMSPTVDTEIFTTFKTSGLSCIRNLYGIEHPFYLEFDDRVRQPSPYAAECGRGILTAIKAEIEGGWFFSVKRLVSSEIFSDFIEMAKYLLDENYKIPAAIMLGSVLEEHLKQLAVKQNIPLDYVNQKGDTVSKKADSINAELTATTIYNKLDQKQITAWLDLRNKAAHGHYDQFTIEQVQLFYNWLLDFINRIAI